MTDKKKVSEFIKFPGMENDIYKKSDFECKCGCGTNNIDMALVSVLQKASYKLGKKLNFTSAVRCKAHNKKEDGSKTSAHLLGKAADVIAVDFNEAFSIITALKAVGVKRFIYYPQRKIIHVDIDIKRGPVIKIKLDELKTIEK